MITYKLKINYQEARILNSDMEFVTGDIGAYRLEFEFYDNGSRDNLAGKLLTVRARRADGVCYASNGEIVDNIGVFVPKNNIYAVPGDLCLEIALSDSAGNYVTTKIITASVIDGIGDVANGAQDDVSIYVTLLAQIKAQIDEANKLVDRANLSIDSHTEDKANPHGVTKAQVGLSNVDNTKDADKPVSTATQAALGLKANAADVYTKTEADALVLGKLAVQGNVNTFSNLPNNAANGDVYRINTGAVYSNDNVSNLLTGNFGTYFHDYSGDGSGYNFTNGLDNVPGLINYFQLGMIGEEYAYYTAIYDGDGNYVCDVYQNADTGPDKKDLAPIMTGDDTVAFYISPFYNVQFYTVGELGLVYMRGGNWYPMADAGWIKREFVPYVTGEDLEEKLSEKADRQTESGGFQAGAATTVGNTGATEGGAIGKNAKETNGGFAGGAGANASYGGVIGKRAAEKNGGGAAGLDTYANAGGAVGSGAVAGSGFSGGKGAKAAPIDESKGTYIDAVQLGTGTNEVPGSLQVYEFQLMDGNGKIPEARLPEAATNSNWGGVVSSWAGLPSTPKLGMYCYVSSDIANGEKYTGKASDMFFSMSNEYPSEILPLGPIKFTAPENCIEPYGTSFAEGYVCVYTENGSKIGKLVYNPTGLPDFIRGEELGLTSMDDTVTFYLGYWDGTNFPAKIEKFSAGSMIFWNGTKWCGVASSDTVGEIETALDGILSIQNALIGGGSV